MLVHHNNLQKIILFIFYCLLLRSAYDTFLLFVVYSNLRNALTSIFIWGYNVSSTPAGELL